MSSILGANTAYPPGEVSYLSDEGELMLDAISTDVISKGALLWHDYANATAGLRGWKKTGTAGAEYGRYAVSTLAKISGVAKVVGVLGGSEVSVTAGATILPGSDVKPSTVTAGAVDQFVQGTTAANLKVGKYVRLAKYSNSGDGNHSIVTANAGDVIIVKLYNN